MPCSAQKVDTAPRGASSGHCEIARRTTGSMGSLTATTRTLGQKCHHQDHPKCHRCPDAELSPMSWEITTFMSDCASRIEHVFDGPEFELIEVMGEATRDESTATAQRLLAVGRLYARRAVELAQWNTWRTDVTAEVAAEVSAAQNVSHARAVG